MREYGLRMPLRRWLLEPGSSLKVIVALLLVTIVSMAALMMVRSATQTDSGDGAEFTSAAVRPPSAGDGGRDGPGS
ncbi:hypothetical protein [Jiangella gansuensis]|uniref:hypothetical protein n=1 Tax=Jiangella gansuensis TaxID=281473 RepID=UPI0004AF9BE9|nr:hypothetical protein [Jiangella gansuensis]